MSEKELSGSLGAGVISVIIVLVVIGTFGVNVLMIFGALVAGVLGGLVAKGKLRGIITGVIGGLIVTVLILELGMVLPSSLESTLLTYTGNSIITMHVFGEIGYAKAQANSTSYIERLVFDVVLMTLLGGFIGGGIHGNGEEEDSS